MVLKSLEDLNREFLIETRLSAATEPPELMIVPEIPESAKGARSSDVGKPPDAPIITGTPVTPVIYELPVMQVMPEPAESRKPAKEPEFAEIWKPADKPPEELPEELSEELPDKPPDELSEGPPDKLQEELPNELPAGPPDKPLEELPDELPAGQPEELPDEMPEALPAVTTPPDGHADESRESLPGQQETPTKAILTVITDGGAVKAGRAGEARRAAEPGKQPAATEKKKRNVIATIADLLFYLAILVVLISVLTSHAPGGEPKEILGYSYYTVLTASMQNEIPKGSLILVHHTDPRDLRIGDNITYMRERNVSVTHKIVDVYEDFDDRGGRGFQTKGVNNVNADKDIVPQENVVGRVILVVPAMGAAISYLNENIYLVFIMYGLCVAFSFCLHWLIGKAKRKKRPADPGMGNALTLIDAGPGGDSDPGAASGLSEAV